MKFNNALMLIGLIAILVPIIIHLLNRSRAKVLDWGAMRFLLASLTSQNRRILVEEMILLALRCLLMASVVLAMAQPFLPTRSRIPWAIALPCFLGAAIALGVAAAMWGYRRARWAMLAVALALGGIAGAASAIEQWWQELKWAAGSGERDIAIILDASMSMTVAVDGKANFERAVEDARAIIGGCKPGDAVSLLLAGPVARAVVSKPTADRQELAAALKGLAPIGGTMNVLGAINAAAESLAEGHNTTKKIVLITDGQAVGWDTRSEAHWRLVAEGLKALPREPKVVCRRLPLPRAFRNVAVGDIAFSRKVVGTDRPVKISVKVMNTGTAPLRPQAVELSVDGVRVASEKLATDIAPRATETVRFDHRFERPGPRVVSARIILDDDLAGDNAADRVVSVVDSLRVPLVDGVPSPAPLGGSAAFVEIALMPSGPPDEDEPAAPDEGEDMPEDEAAARKAAAERDRGDDVRFLVEPTVVPAPDIAAVKNLHDYAAVVLANVPSLPDAVAKDLVGFVQAGGGLLIAPGSRAKPTFYNNWSTPRGEPVMPADLTARRDVQENPVRLEPRTFSHPALALLADTAASDAGLALVKSYWRLETDERDPAIRVGGRLATAEPFLVERKLGKGYVLLLATSLDHAGGNLPALKSFVPMLHEAIAYLAAPMMLDSNVAPGTDLVLELHETDTGASALPAQAPSRTFPHVREGNAAATLPKVLEPSGGSWEAIAEVLTPSQRHCPAKLARDGGVLRVSFAGTEEPGLYTLTLPPGLAARYAPPGTEGRGIPFVALSRIEESILDPLTPADMELPRQSMDLFETERSDEVSAQVFGGVPGEDLWKYFIIGALLALLGETAVTRWIAVQRRLGAAPTVVFGSEVVDVQTFRDRAHRLLTVPAKSPEPVGKP